VNRFFFTSASFRMLVAISGCLATDIPTCPGTIIDDYLLLPYLG
jgi:hypothetical protein